uniref:Uncharacterized protein n=1 Tax=Arundo donax TaxID=35708 RepID=A0A0A9GF07_ARUDO
MSLEPGRTAEEKKPQVLKEKFHRTSSTVAHQGARAYAQARRALGPPLPAAAQFHG